MKNKFRVGDWIITDKKHIWLVDEDCSTTGYLYRLVAINGKVEVAECEVVDKHAHLWTIEDVKDGDVLINDFHLIFIFKEIKNNMYISHCSIIDRGNDVIINIMAEREVGDVNLVKCQPATKEQRDQLEKVMADAGYIFDFDGKKLKKIEQKPAECNNSILKDKLLELFQRFRWYCKDEIPTNGDIIEYVDAHIQELIDTVQNKPWSEEDKKMSRFIGNAITADDASMYLESKGVQIIDAHVWLEDLKDRVQPQPKQEWDEEDENMIKRIKEYLNIAIGDLSNKLNGRIVTIGNSEYSSMMFEISMCISWLEVRLKSIRPQNRWKPSDEQMKVLKKAFHCVSKMDEEVLKSLYNELTKLRGGE